MRIPEKIPHLWPVTLLVGLYTAVWSTLEGRLAYDVLLAVAALALFMAWFVVRRLGGRTLPRGWGVALATATGAAYGVGVVLLTLLLMILKTGLHAHGPEYTAAQVAWVWRQAPLWGAAGALAGLGVGLLLSGKR